MKHNGVIFIAGFTDAHSTQQVLLDYSPHAIQWKGPTINDPFLFTRVLSNSKNTFEKHLVANLPLSSRLTAGLSLLVDDPHHKLICYFELFA